MSGNLPATAPEQSAEGEVRRRIGVAPVRAALASEKLLAALQEVFPVVFEAREPSAVEGLDGLIVLQPGGAEQLALSTPTLWSSSCPGPSATRELVEFAREVSVKRPLRGRRLLEHVAHGRPPVGFQDGDAVMASVAGEPVWWRRARVQPAGYVSAFSLGELREGETLREHLRIGRFMGLVPVLHFLADICAEINWSEPPLRASFVIDDPNLHRSSYGYIDYPTLIRHATAHGYHLGLAMVPLDGWFANRRAAAMVKTNGDSLSVLVHGNDHTARELGALSADSDAEAVLGQALRRLASFERRSGVSVKRVMAPPHGACSEPALRAMFRLGFDAACISRPYPWRDRLPAPSASAGWHPAEMVGGGLPILPRYPIERPRDELVFRALLHQPLILYGHHWDLAQGLDVLAHVVQEVDSLGEVRWGPLDWIAQGNYASRSAGALMEVRMYSRRLLIDVPRGITAVRAHTREIYGGPLWRDLLAGTSSAAMVRGASGWTSGVLPVSPDSQIQLTLRPDRALRPGELPHRPVRVWPIVRRTLVEGRDRMRPLLG